MFNPSNRFGAAIGVLLISFAFAAPNAWAKTQPAPNASPTGAPGCLSVPKGFSTPAVKADAAPASLWQGWHYGHGVTLAGTPASALMDQPVDIRVGGLKSGEPITLHLKTKDYQGNVWSSRATFRANAKGKVDVAKMAPVYGGYSGVHAMGLVWSLLPETLPKGVKNASAAYFIPAARYMIELTAEANGQVLAHTTLTRYHQAPGVAKTEVASDGLVGDFYRPATPGRHPAVLVLGGSEGGLHPQVDEAALLASHGYAALGLAYFQGFGNQANPRLAKLPKMLVNIPLEYFVKAAHWLKHQPGVDPRHVAIMGWSKGAEAALITAATFPKEFQAVIAFMPSSIVWAGINYGGGPPGSSWTVAGKPLPWANPVMDPALYKPGKMIAFRDSYQTGLQDKTAVGKAVIPVEKIAGPVLLISAGDDQIWPSSVMAEQIMQRLAAQHHDYADESLCYAAAGHIILPPYRPTNASAFGYPGGGFVFGGNPVAYAFADVDAWHKLLTFLHTALR